MSHVKCHMSHVTCHVSRVMCHMSLVTCQQKIYIYICDKVVELVVEGLLTTGPTRSSFNRLPPVKEFNFNSCSETYF